MLGSGVSSESIWTPFDSITTALSRQTVGRVLIAWTRLADISSYATVGGSIVGGTDIVKGVSDSAINNADTFQYFDETARTIRIEYERHLIEPLGGMSIAMADVVLDNTDLRFTPNVNSTIGTALRPNRPMKLFVGFQVAGQEKVIPVIEGLTLQPREDKNRRTVTISGYDYLKWLNEKPQETAIYQNQRSDQIIADILARAGVGSSNYALDLGLNTVGFAWFEKGQTAGERIRQLCEAEEAIFYQDENGIMRFENRNKYSQSPYNVSVWNIDPEDILTWEDDSSTEIINRVIVSGKPRSVKSETEIWRDGVEEEILPGETKEIWANFEDPVSSMTSPVATTDFTAFSASGGAGTNITASVAIVTTDFTKSAKLEITNNHGSATAYVNYLRIRGLPATIDYEIMEVFQDTVSIEDYNENQKEIDNQFIDDRSFAANMAQNIVRRHKLPNQVIRIRIRGIPQLQLRDQVRVKDMDRNAFTNYRVIGIQGVLEGAAFTQTLRLRKITSSESL